MSNSAITTANTWLNRAVDMLSPSPHSEKLVFRRFKGDALALAVATGGSIDPKKDVDTVVLRINPTTVSFTKTKIINRVQTSAPGRFVVFDWGTDLLGLNISGNTGNLLPDDIVKGYSPVSSTMESINNVLSAVNGPTLGSAAFSAVNQAEGFFQNVTQNAIFRSSTYNEILNMSPKYKTFKRLEQLYTLSDADKDVIILEFGDMATYRGFFQEFSFSVEAENPWNWKYQITFVVLAELNSFVQRSDQAHNVSATTKG